VKFDATLVGLVMVSQEVINWGGKWQGKTENQLTDLGKVISFSGRGYRIETGPATQAA